MSSNPNYFEIRRLRNLTTELTLLKTLEKEPIEAVEFYKHLVTFEAPQKACVYGQLISLGGVLHFKNRHEEFDATGRVSTCLDLDDKKCKYTIEMYRFDKKLWDDFREAIAKAQSDVDHLFRSMRDLD